MPALGINFDARSVPPAEAGFPVWEGVVLHAITRTEIQDTSANDGSRMLVLFVTAVDGHYTGQENAIRLNLWNKNPKASEVGSRQLSSICHVTNRLQVSDSDQLRGAVFIGIWAKETRKVQDQQTGKERELESCQCKDYRVADGRTIKELIAGQPASAPYSAQRPATPGHAAPAQAAPGGGFAPGAAGGFAQPGQMAPPMGAPHGAPAGVPPGGFGAPAAPQGAPSGFGSGQPAFPGAAPSMAMTPHPAPQGGFAPQGAPGQPGGAFQPQGGPPPGFGAPAQGSTPPGFGGQPTAGPWGQQ